MPLPPLNYNPPLEPYLSVLHSDEHILVLSKPSGLLSVPGKAAEHSDCLESRAREAHPCALIIHRLDKDTSGLMVMGIGKSAHRNLSIQFQKRKVRKKYVAIVAGHPQETEGSIDLPLRCDWPNRPLQMVDFELGKCAQTFWRVLVYGQGRALLELTPITGRSHQLRVHLKEIGHPILGDAFYGPEQNLAETDRLQLHATELSFHHPADGKWVTFRDPAPFSVECAESL